ncbi:13300_t:CDS:2, partial [Acaulospora colombiana]
MVKEPITALHPNSASDALLVTTLHGKVYLLDRATGQSLNTFSGHVHESYRCGACFDGSPETKDSKSTSTGKRTGGGEETVLLGDEEGRVWAWDLVNATALDPSPPPKMELSAFGVSEECIQRIVSTNKPAGAPKKSLDRVCDLPIPFADTVLQPNPAATLTFIPPTRSPPTTMLHPIHRITPDDIKGIPWRFGLTNEELYDALDADIGYHSVDGKLFDEL